MLFFQKETNHIKLKKGVFAGAAALALSVGSIFASGSFAVYAQTQGTWSINEDDYYIYTDSNGWVFNMYDSKTSDVCFLESVPVDTSGELYIPSKIRLDSVVRTVALSDYFVIPSGVTKVYMPKYSTEYSSDWFENFEGENSNLTVCYYETDEPIEYLKYIDYKTEILDPAGAEVIGGEEADNWDYDATISKYVYTDENGCSYSLKSKDDTKCSLLSIRDDAQGELAINKEVTIEGVTRTLYIESDCRIPAGITKVSFGKDAPYFTQELFAQCSPNLVVSIFIENSEHNSNFTSSRIDDIKKGLTIEYADGITKDGIIYYILNSGKEAAVFGYTETASNLTVSSKVTINGNSYNVTELSLGAFSGNKKLKKVTLPNTVKTIYNYAFSDCTALTNITLPSKLTDLGGYVFEGCTSLTSIKLPSGVKTIYNGVFDGCKKLKKVELSKNVNHLGDYVFSDCTSLTTITNLNNVTGLGSETFLNCKKLTSLTFPKVNDLGAATFYGCTSLKSLTFGSKSMTHIGEGAFQNAKNLKTLTIKATNLSSKNIGANILKGTNSKLVIKVPSKKVSAYKKLLKKYGNTKITVKKI